MIRPPWEELQGGKRPSSENAEPGELAIPRVFHFRVPLSGDRERFRTLGLERLRLPLQIAEAQCECGALLDVQGRHRAACPRSRRLRSRAVGPERTLARVCREAGATVRCNVRLRDMNVAVSVTYMRSIEVLATGLPLHHGAQLVVDITLRSALTSASHACTSAATIDGAVLVKARADKERKHAELVNGDRCRLVVVGVETGSRWR